MYIIPFSTVAKMATTKSHYGTIYFPEGKANQQQRQVNTATMSLVEVSRRSISNREVHPARDARRVDTMLTRVVLVLELTPSTVALSNYHV